MSFTGIEIGRRGISSHQTALETTGHNISNADNEHYSRQRVSIRSSSPLYLPALNRAEVAGMKGQGTQVELIERIRNHFIDDRINTTRTEEQYWDAKNNYFYQLENIFNEPSDNSLRSKMNEFWAAWQEMSKFPEDLSHREVLIQKTEGMTSRIQDTFRKLTRLRDQANENVQTLTLEVNSLASTIRNLNESIIKSEALGDQPNDLKDKRDEALEKLSGLVDISVSRGDQDELMVFIGQQVLVQGEVLNKLEARPDPENDGMAQIYWQKSGKNVLLRGGRIQGLLEMRDIHIPENIRQIDSLAVNTMDIVNEIHRDGFGLSGRTNINFFRANPLSRDPFGNFDLNNDGTPEVSAIFRVSGANKLELKQPIGVDGVMTFHRPDVNNSEVKIGYRADESLETIIDRVNKSESGIYAYLNHQGQLVLKSDTHETQDRENFMIRHLEDSGQFLVGFAGILNATGPAGSFDYSRVNDINKLQPPPENISYSPSFHPAAWMSISREVKNNPTLIAAAQGKDVGGTGDFNTPNGIKDGNNALLIANAIKHRESMIGMAKNPDEFYNALISRLSTQAQESKNQLETQKEMFKNLVSQRQSVSGVSLDEEMANMVKFQHGYNAAARVISTMDQMLDTIINRLGL